MSDFCNYVGVVLPSLTGASMQSQTLVQLAMHGRKENKYEGKNNILANCPTFPHKTQFTIPEMLCHSDVMLDFFPYPFSHAMPQSERGHRYLLDRCTVPGWPLAASSSNWINQLNHIFDCFPGAVASQKQDSYLLAVSPVFNTTYPNTWNIGWLMYLMYVPPIVCVRTTFECCPECPEKINPHVFMFSCYTVPSGNLLHSELENQLLNGKIHYFYGNDWHN